MVWVWLVGQAGELGSLSASGDAELCHVNICYVMIRVDGNWYGMALDSLDVVDRILKQKLSSNYFNYSNLQKSRFTITMMDICRAEVEKKTVVLSKLCL